MSRNSNGVWRTRGTRTRPKTGRRSFLAEPQNDEQLPRITKCPFKGKKVGSPRKANGEIFRKLVFSRVGIHNQKRHPGVERRRVVCLSRAERRRSEFDGRAAAKPFLFAAAMNCVKGMAKKFLANGISQRASKLRFSICFANVKKVEKGEES